MRLSTRSPLSDSNQKPPPESDHGGGYDPAFYAELHAAEDRHFWFRARNRVIETITRAITTSATSPYYALEIGCGNGNATRYLQKACGCATVIGMDLFSEGLRYARARGIRLLVRGEASQSPFGTKFNLIGMFDVLEHVEDDAALLQHLRPLLHSGGHIVITVPAHASLWSYFDEASHHCRRYSLNELCCKLENAGYAVEYSTEFMTAIYPFLRLQRLWAGRRHAGRVNATELAKDELRVNPVVNFFLRALLWLEVPWIRRRRRLPVGTSILAVAYKRP